MFDFFCSFFTSAPRVYDDFKLEDLPTGQYKVIGVESTHFGHRLDLETNEGKTWSRTYKKEPEIKELVVSANLRGKSFIVYKKNDSKGGGLCVSFVLM